MSAGAFSAAHAYALEKYVDRLMDQDRQRGAQTARRLYGVDYGPVYAKVWRKDYPGDPSRSVVVFVGYDGTLYRADSWKKRGRIVGHLDRLREPGRDRARRSASRRASRVRSRRRS